MALLAGSIGEGLLNFFGGKSGQEKNIEWERERFYAALRDAQNARNRYYASYNNVYLPMFRQAVAEDAERRRPMTESVAVLGPGINSLLGMGRAA